MSYRAFYPITTAVWAAFLAEAGLAAPLNHAPHPEIAAPAALEEVLRLALGRNRALQASYEAYQAALERIPQAAALPNPRVSFDHFIKQIHMGNGPLENQMMLSQTLPWFGKLRLQESIASEEAQALLHEYEMLRLALVRDVSVAHFRYAYLGKEHELTERTLELLERLAAVTETRVRGGAPLSGLLRLEVETGRNRDLLATLERDRSRQSVELRRLMNLPPDGPVPPFAPLPPRPATDLREEALRAAVLSGNPAIRALSARGRSAAQRERLSRLLPIPDPALNATWMHLGEGASDAYGVGISFEIPLWTKKYRAQREEARRDAAALAALQEDREYEILAELETQLESLRETSAREVLYRERLLPVARQSLEISETEYRAGKLNLTDIIESERTLLELERVYWNAVAQIHIQLVRLDTLGATIP
ncbi:MAG TPA: TolC family protein [Verrucomicrobiales bacterium]|nr:TolC family protein [Verrucomicrobiales bacterium]